ncbi:MAG: IclR family transcriptional regulator [Kocuria sp.]|uniref:IclR family transcriptional regulator n=1 Tax=Kocuria sp. TaxID=1871328 RepID=UPI0026DD0E2C|nr:IclR family transcriptional regulator [Kocuria sp.]MDO4255927.1 IclR family transcriptional regulator [Kocuria sp.]
MARTAEQPGGAGRTRATSSRAGTTSGTQVVGRVAAVLQAVAAAGTAGTAEIARSTGLTRPTAHRLLTALAHEGLLDRDGTGHWALGFELTLLGAVAAQRYPAQDLATPHLRRLAEATGESAFFSARRGDEVICLERAEGSFPVRSHVLHEGLRLPLGVASAGLAILGHLPDEQLEAALAATRERRGELGPQHDDAHVRRLVSHVREHGWSLNPGRIVEGSWGMAAAVFDASGQPRYALSLTGIESRFRPPRQHQLGTALLDQAHRLSTALRTGRATS